MRPINRKAEKVMDRLTQGITRENSHTRIDNNKPGMIKNADGSYDVYFGPKAPKGQENNWVQTVPGKSWSVILRLYGPLEAWYNKTWRPGEIELVK